MKLNAILLRWYRSFNVTAMGPGAQQPTERWHQHGENIFPFVRVPVDGRITSIVGANESGKSHLLSALSKVFNAEGTPGSMIDKYEIKDVCRYSGFSPLEGMWADIGVELTVSTSEASLFEPASDEKNPAQSTGGREAQVLTVILNGGKEAEFATVYKNDTIVKTFEEAAWFDFVSKHLPKVECLDSRLALPNEVHIDELLDLYAGKKPGKVVEPMTVQDLWRELEGMQVLDGGAVNEATAKRVEQLKKAIEKALRKPQAHEGRLVRLLFEDILGVTTEHLERMREYSVSERGYVSSMNDEINRRIGRELDITQYWDQDEDFRLSVNYKSGFFHFQITDRTGSTYTFNERSSGLRYFLSYYIQAKAIERSHSENGSIILMDEPDNFLSASAQRSLLRVFEALVGAKVAKGMCQLIYTTHSPFLINRNFPERIRLVRKGDGAEGTQYVSRSAVRRFEPIRSALAIDSADTLFLGSINVILEGPGDQKVLAACVQKFGKPGKLDEFIDLNSVTLVSSGGAPYATDLVRKAVKGDEKPPIVVVLLDGDESGASAVAQIGDEIDPRQATTLRNVEVGPGKVFEVLEDIVPAALMSEAISRFAAFVGDPSRTVFDASGDGNTAKKIERFCRETLPSTKHFTDIEIRSGITDVLVEMLSDETLLLPAEAELRANVVAICATLNKMIAHAQRSAAQRSLKYTIGLQIESFFKWHSEGASKGELKQLLENVHQAAFGKGQDHKATRSNCEELMESLDAQVQNNSDQIDLRNWTERLKAFAVQPWDGKTKKSKPALTGTPLVADAQGSSTVIN